MNRFSIPYRRVLVILLWILVICLAAHFLNDLQPDHSHLPGTASRFCSMAIHSGALVALLPTLAILALIFEKLPFQQVSEHSGSLSVPVPPPIYS